MIAVGTWGTNFERCFCCRKLGTTEDDSVKTVFYKQNADERNRASEEQNISEGRCGITTTNDTKSLDFGVSADDPETKKAIPNGNSTERNDSNQKRNQHDASPRSTVESGTELTPLNTPLNCTANYKLFNVPNTVSGDLDSASESSSLPRPNSRIHSPSYIPFKLRNDQQFDTEKESLRQKYEELKLEVENQKLQNRKLIEALSHGKREREELLLRLSKFTSNQLADNNPYIADLGDINRPTKLAEQFSELYDNEWTEQFSQLTTDGQTEKVAIKELLENLQTIFNLCKQKSTDQMKQAFEAIYGLTRQNENYGPIKRSMKEFKEERKKNHKVFLSEIRKELCEKLPDNPFVKKAIKLCWLMCVQDPPMDLLFYGHKKKKFDDTLFKAYTEAGKYTDFVVWPAILLHEGGSLLSKGVAQGKQNKKKSTANHAKDSFIKSREKADDKEKEKKLNVNEDKQKEFESKPKDRESNELEEKNDEQATDKTDQTVGLNKEISASKSIEGTKTICVKSLDISVQEENDGHLEQNNKSTEQQED